ncbi:hypothetical protein SARC_15332, partial [Sphaeroforma arctica JP610]
IYRFLMLFSPVARLVDYIEDCDREMELRSISRSSSLANSARNSVASIHSTAARASPPTSSQNLSHFTYADHSNTTSPHTFTQHEQVQAPSRHTTSTQHSYTPPTSTSSSTSNSANTSATALGSLTAPAGGPGIAGTPGPVPPSHTQAQRGFEAFCTFQTEAGAYQVHTGTCV